MATAFFDAAKRQDKDDFAALLTEEARAFVDSGQGFNLSENAYESYTIGATTVSGDTAAVETKVTQEGAQHDVTLKMRKDPGAWHVYGMEIGGADGNSMEVNFEKMGTMLDSMAQSMGNAIKEGFQQAVDNWQNGGSEQEIAEKQARFEQLRALTKEEFEAQWRNNTDFTGRPALEALNELAKSMGLVVFPGDYAEKLRAPVESNVRSLSRMEAIERIANESGLYPVYPRQQQLGGLAGTMVTALDEGMTSMLSPDTSAISVKGGIAQPDTKHETDATDEPPANSITFKPGPRKYPAAFAGPYMVYVDDVTENVPHGTGEVTVAAAAYGLDPGVLLLLDDLGEKAVFERIEDSQGRSLNADEDVRYVGGGTIAGSAFRDTTSIDLKNLLRDVEAIALIKGEQRIVVPEHVETLEFATLREGVSTASGDVRVTVKRTGKNTEFDVRAPEDRLENLTPMFSAKDADGNDLGIQFQSAARWGKDKLQASLQTREPPAHVTMKLVDRTVLGIPFELHETPLEHFSEMPAEIAALSFEGYDAPVDVEFVGFIDRDNPDFPKVAVRVENHSNKDAMTLHVEFVYLDRDGAELKSFPHTLTGTYSIDGAMPSAAAGESVEMETTAFFMPEDTDRLKVHVDKVEFIDGTKWEPLQ